MGAMTTNTEGTSSGIYKNINNKLITVNNAIELLISCFYPLLSWYGHEDNYDDE